MCARVCARPMGSSLAGRRPLRVRAGVRRAGGSGGLLACVCKLVLDASDEGGRADGGKLVGSGTASDGTAQRAMGESPARAGAEREP